MSNTKVLNCSSIRHPTTTTATTGIRGVSDYNLRQTTVNQQSSVKSKMMHVETAAEKTTTTQRVKEMKKLNANINNLSPLNSPQLIRSTRAKVAESNGWNNSIKVKSSCSSGSNSVESIVPKYQIAMTTNSSVSSQKRSYLNQTSTVNKLSNRTMNMRNDKSKKETTESLSTQKVIENGCSKKKTVPITTAKKMLKSTFPSTSPAKSFSAKFPNGLPFENEFYHYRKNNHRSSVASDSTTSNNSSDEFTNNQRLSNSPYHDEFRRNPSNDALYVDFTLKSFDNFDSDDDKNVKKMIAKPPALTTKTKYILTDKNCFCEFETVKSSAESSPKSTIGQKKQQVDFMSAASAKQQVNKDSIVYVTSANIFPKCNAGQEKNENAISQTK